MFPRIFSIFPDFSWFSSRFSWNINSTNLVTWVVFIFTWPCSMLAESRHGAQVVCCRPPRPQPKLVCVCAVWLGSVVWQEPWHWMDVDCDQGACGYVASAMGLITIILNGVCFTIILNVHHYLWIYRLHNAQSIHIFCKYYLNLFRQLAGPCDGSGSPPRASDTRHR